MKECYKMKVRVIKEAELLRKFWRDSWTINADQTVRVRTKRGKVFVFDVIHSKNDTERLGDGTQ